MKYVMLAINGKEIDGDTYVRRVLLEYKSKEIANCFLPTARYLGTRLVETDSYFKDQTRSLQYEFKDDLYRLTSTKYDDQNSQLINEERTYHGFLLDEANTYGRQFAPIEFEAESDEEAIKKFNERNELR